ncbi:MAG: hypothetical protein QOH61_708 [Chloroflexota bacterium]|nr:hypothetical protein [Chloroflexota bacterium]
MLRITSIRNAALVGALLALTGGGAALASAPASHVVSAVSIQKSAVSTAAEPLEATDTDNVQEGDQTTPDTGTEPVETTDTDTLQEGDQTTPDTGTVDSAASAVSTLSTSAVAPAAAAAAPDASAEPTTPETGTEAPGTETEAANDGPGGHEDPAGQNVDHQFDGEE